MVKGKIKTHAYLYAGHEAGKHFAHGVETLCQGDALGEAILFQREASRGFLTCRSIPPESIVGRPPTGSVAVLLDGGSETGESWKIFYLPFWQLSCLVMESRPSADRLAWLPRQKPDPTQKARLLTGNDASVEYETLRLALQGDCGEGVYALKRNADTKRLECGRATYKTAAQPAGTEVSILDGSGLTYGRYIYFYHVTAQAGFCLPLPDFNADDPA